MRVAPHIEEVTTPKRPAPLVLAETSLHPGNLSTDFFKESLKIISPLGELNTWTILVKPVADL